MNWENILKRKPTEEEIEKYKASNQWDRIFAFSEGQKKAIEKEIDKRRKKKKHEDHRQKRLEEKVRPPSKAERMKQRHQKGSDELKSDIRKGEWDFDTTLDVEHLEIKNSAFKRTYSDSNYDYTEYNIEGLYLKWTIDIELKDYGIKSMYPLARSGSFELKIEFEPDDDLDEKEGDMRIKDNDYSLINERIEVDEEIHFEDTGEGPNFVDVESLEIDMKNEKDPSKWSITAVLRQGGTF